MLKTRQYLNVKNIICCRAYTDKYLLACTIFIEPCSWVCFDKRTVTSIQTLLLRSALTLGQRPSKHTFPKPNSNACFRFWGGSPTAGSLSHSGYGGLAWKYRTPIRKTSRSERPHFTLWAKMSTSWADRGKWFNPVKHLWNAVVFQILKFLSWASSVSSMRFGRCLWIRWRQAEPRAVPNQMVNHPKVAEGARQRLPKD